MAKITPLPPESVLVQICPLRWWEIADTLLLWIEREKTAPESLANIGPLYPLEDAAGNTVETPRDYTKRIARGLAALSKELE